MDRVSKKKAEAAAQSLSPPAAPQPSLPATLPADPLTAGADLEQPGAVVKMKPLPLVQVVSKERRSLTFEALEMKITNPKLTFLGEGTSSTCQPIARSLASTAC